MYQSGQTLNQLLYSFFQTSSFSHNLLSDFPSNRLPHSRVLPLMLTKAALATAANVACGLAMDSIAAAHSGHMGLPLGDIEVGATLYGS